MKLSQQVDQESRIDDRSTLISPLLSSKGTGNLWQR